MGRGGGGGSRVSTTDVKTIRAPMKIPLKFLPYIDGRGIVTLSSFLRSHCYFVLDPPLPIRPNKKTHPTNLDCYINLSRCNSKAHDRAS